MARDILAGGRWLLPALPDGTPHLEKPPLTAWLIALASWPAGRVTVRSAMLPSLLEALGVVLVTSALGTRLFGPPAGVVAGLAAATTVGIYMAGHSTLPDMAQLLALTATLAAYVASEGGRRRGWLVAAYALLGLGTLAKGTAGLLPLAIVLPFTLLVGGPGGLRPLASLPGLAVFLIIAVPWWVVAARAAGLHEVVRGVLFADQVRWYFWSEHWRWRTVLEPLVHAVAVTLPWCALLPVAVIRLLRERDSGRARASRLLLVWFASVFVIVALAGQQRERYYLPLCPATALLIGAWYSTLRWRWRAVAFAGAVVAAAGTGAALDTIDIRRARAMTDFSGLRAVVAAAPAPIHAMDVPALALSFAVERPVAARRDYASSVADARKGQAGYLVVSDRVHRGVPPPACLRPVATGALGRPFTVLRAGGC